MMNTTHWQSNAVGYTTVEMLLDDVSKQMASSNLSRYSRGPSGQKIAGSMRIVKPNSASNSPRGSMGLGRRRTVMNDGAYRRRLAMLEQQNATAGENFVANGALHTSQRSTRPVSWHPASHLVPHQHYQPSYQVPTNDSNQFQLFDHSTDNTVYSGYTSPDPTFSPQSVPFNTYEDPQYIYQTLTRSNPLSNSSYLVNQQHQQAQIQCQPSYNSYFPQSTENTDPTMYSHFDWNHFATNGFENSSTAPPTPENFLPIQHPEPTFPAEDNIPYHPLSDPESDGEELIGMGLYDAPEVAKTPSSNPELDSYRALMMTGFLGTGCRKAQATGKGLKLEETWQPPPSDDEDEEEDDDEQDGEGDLDDEVKEERQAESLYNYPSGQTQMSTTNDGYGGPGWV